MCIAIMIETKKLLSQLPKNKHSSVKSSYILMHVAIRLITRRSIIIISNIIKNVENNKTQYSKLVYPLRNTITLCNSYYLWFHPHHFYSKTFLSQRKDIRNWRSWSCGTNRYVRMYNCL